MGFVFCNPNPDNLLIGDCVIRAISIAEDLPWEDTYINLVIEGYLRHDMPSSNAVWGSYLEKKGYIWDYVPRRCPTCYNVRDFSKEVPGTYILATGTHVVAVIDGDYYDTWDSGNETPVYYWKKGI